jgi:hypothetical protein
MAAWTFFIGTIITVFGSLIFTFVSQPQWLQNLTRRTFVHTMGETLGKTSITWYMVGFGLFTAFCGILYMS